MKKKKPKMPKPRIPTAKGTIVHRDGVTHSKAERRKRRQRAILEEMKEIYGHSLRRLTEDG